MCVCVCVCVGGGGGGGGLPLYLGGDMLAEAAGLRLSAVADLMTKVCEGYGAAPYAPHIPFVAGVKGRIRRVQISLDGCILGPGSGSTGRQGLSCTSHAPS